MYPFRRAQVGTLLKRLEEPPRRIISLVGPRQSGKTTIVRQALAQIRRDTDRATFEFAADGSADPEIHQVDTGQGMWGHRPGARYDSAWIVRQWEWAREISVERREAAVLVFDEIQAIPDWSTTVKGLWDADERLPHRPHVVILGSAPMRIQSGLRESLVGRFEQIEVHHWSFSEMNRAFGFDLSTYLYYGGFPGVADLVGHPDRWRSAVRTSFIEPTIERDILALTRVDKPVLLKRLFEAAAEYSGQVVSYSKLVGDLTDAGNTTTLARYLELLEAIECVAGLSNHRHSLLRVKRSTPKLIVLNPGLMSAFSGHAFEQTRADSTRWGRVVESAVGGHLFANRDSRTRLRYWQDRNVEVDFVLERGPELLGLEVKSGAARGGHRGLETFRARFPKAQTLLVGEGGVPLSEFLSTPAETWFEAR